jgi:hypothetical protein
MDPILLSFPGDNVLLPDASRDNARTSLLLCAVKRVSLEFGERSCQLHCKYLWSDRWSKLPDSLMKGDGVKTMKKSDWLCRKAEIRQLEEKSEYGEKKTVRPRQGRSLVL